MKFWHPRYWLIWLGISVLWLVIKLPLRVQASIAKRLGGLLFRLLSKRRQVSCINLKLAFPELDQATINHLNRQHFNSLIMGFFEAAMSWWASDSRLSQLYTFEGEQYLIDALSQNRGIILLSAHFTSLELGGRLLNDHLEKVPLHFVYRPHQNDLLEAIVANNRTKRYGKVIPKRDIRNMVRTLKQKHPLWYAQDQSYQGKSSVEVSFFDVQTDTNSATSWLAKISGALVVPFYTIRNKDNTGFILRALPPLENFPCGDDIADTQRINDLIETQVREFPEQYLWTHKRFKTATSDYYSKQHAEDIYCP
ncbi:MAG: lipid A biosynthesis lauroyl acyltransferase [Thiotrichaceae bacterium]|nr:lipid A biosynthesis lauroyl acyltransferase [Thiotrichaceae bacterium]